MLSSCLDFLWQLFIQQEKYLCRQNVVDIFHATQRFFCVRFKNTKGCHQFIK